MREGFRMADGAHVPLVAFSAPSPRLLLDATVRVGLVSLVSCDLARFIHVLRWRAVPAVRPLLLVLRSCHS